MKQCAKCGASKPLEAFPPSTQTNDGLFAWCRSCKSDYNKAYLKKHAPRVLALRKKYKANDPERYNEYGRRTRRNCRPQINARAKKKYATNIQNRMYRTLGNRLRKALRAQWSRALTDLVGCSVADFKAHIAAQFVKGMTWANHGVDWELDHKIPCSAFDLSKSEQQKTCFHFSNTQPLWTEDNLQKGSKILKQATLLP